MKTRLLISILFASLTFDAGAALTNVTRETFQGVRTLDAGSPGNLGTVDAGAFYARVGGPRLTNDESASGFGWSADLRLVAGDLQRQHTMNINATAAATNGCYSAFYFVRALIGQAAAFGELCRTRQDNGNFIVTAGIKPGSPQTNGNFWVQINGLWTDTDTGVAVPLMQWFELRHAWGKVSGTTYNYLLAMRLAGSSSWTTIVSNQYTFQQSLKEAQGGNIATGGGGSSYIQARYGMPGIYALGTFGTDSTALIADVADPVGYPTLYVNPSNGNDTNSGASPSEAWQSAGKINEESRWLGLIPSYGFSNGTTLVVDTSGSALLLGTNQLVLQTRGLRVRPSVGNRWITVQPWTNIANAAFSAVAGQTRIYKATLPVGQSNVVVWENDKWLYKPNGATFGSVSNFLWATNGSFFSDSSGDVYLHSTDSSDPAGNGRSYTRSIMRTPGGLAAITIWAPDVWIEGIHAGKTCLAQTTDADPFIGNVLQGESLFGGTSVVTNCHLFYGSKHGLSFTDANSNAVVTIADVTVEQCSPYSSQTPFVSYNGGMTATNNIHTYLRCTNLFVAGLFGSTNGSAGLIDSFYSHNNGGNYQFKRLVFDGCNFGGSIGSAGAMEQIIITNSSFGGGIFNSPLTRIDQSRATGLRLPMNGNTNQTLVMRSSVVQFTNVMSDSLPSVRYLIGTNDCEGCTFSFSSDTGNEAGRGVFRRTGRIDGLWRHNIFISTAAASFFQDTTNTDALTLSSNVYVLGSGGKIASGHNGNDRTFAQWQALGFDSGSITNDPLLAADYKPAAASPAIGLGSGAAGYDLSGTYFEARNTAGAYEYLAPATPLYSIGIGTVANDGTGDKPRIAGQKINSNTVTLASSILSSSNALAARMLTVAQQVAATNAPDAGGKLDATNGVTGGVLTVRGDGPTLRLGPIYEGESPGGFMLGWDAGQMVGTNLFTGENFIFGGSSPRSFVTHDQMTGGVLAPTNEPRLFNPVLQWDYLPYPSPSRWEITTNTAGELIVYWQDDFGTLNTNAVFKTDGSIKAQLADITGLQAGTLAIGSGGKITVLATGTNTAGGGAISWGKDGTNVSFYTADGIGILTRQNLGTFGNLSGATVYSTSGLRSVGYGDYTVGFAATGPKLVRHPAPLGASWQIVGGDGVGTVSNHLVLAGSVIPTNGLMLPPITTSPAGISNGMASLWNSNGFVFLRYSVPNYTTNCDKPMFP